MSNILPSAEVEKVEDNGSTVWESKGLGFDGSLLFVGVELDLYKALRQVWRPSRWELECNEGRYRLGS